MNVEDFGIVQSLLHSVANSVIVGLCLNDSKLYSLDATSIQEHITHPHGKYRRTDARWSVLQPR